MSQVRGRGGLLGGGIAVVVTGPVGTLAGIVVGTIVGFIATLLSGLLGRSGAGSTAEPRNAIKAQLGRRIEDIMAQQVRPSIVEGVRQILEPQFVQAIQAAEVEAGCKDIAARLAVARNEARPLLEANGARVSAATVTSFEQGA